MVLAVGVDVPCRGVRDLPDPLSSASSSSQHTNKISGRNRYKSLNQNDGWRTHQPLGCLQPPTGLEWPASPILPP
jgi:hypothetical protein